MALPEDILKVSTHGISANLACGVLDKWEMYGSERLRKNTSQYYRHKS